jgi:hypothetical protein
MAHIFSGARNFQDEVFEGARVLERLEHVFDTVWVWPI